MAKKIKKRMVGNTKESNKRHRLLLDKMSVESRLDISVETPKSSWQTKSAKTKGYSGHNNAKQSNLIGLKFGELTVIELIGQKKANPGNYIYNCLCSCGYHTRAFSDALIEGRKTACGGNHHKEKTRGNAHRIGKSWFCACGNKVDPKFNHGFCGTCMIKKRANALPDNHPHVRTAQIIKLRKNGWTFNQIGQFFGISYQRVQQILKYC